MKYLRGYKIFESIDRQFLISKKDLTKDEEDLINSIEDICLDLTDDGFYILIDEDNNNYHDFGGDMFIKIIKKGQNWPYSESSDVIKRLQSFLGEKFVSIFIDDGSTDAWMTLDRYVGKYDSDKENIVQIIISFKI